MFRVTPGSGPRLTAGLVISRGSLSFTTFSVKTRHRMNTASLLKLQSSFIPFPDAPVNMIYEIATRGRRDFLSWTSADSISDALGARELLPESLVFHCRPRDLDQYKLFVFRRDPGFEVIFWESPRFYSLHAETEAEIPACLLSLIRHCGIGDCPRILSDVVFPVPRKEIRIDRTSPEWGYLFLPRHARLKRRYSRFAESLRVREQRGRTKSWILGLNLLAILLAVGVLFELALLRESNLDFRRMNAAYEETVKIRRELAETDAALRKAKIRLGEYPDHLRCLHAVCAAMDPKAFVTEYALKRGKLELNGYTPDSLQLVKRLRRVPGFSEVQLRNQVVRNSKAGREKFQIEITLD